MIIVSKYEPLWKWIKENKTDNFKLTYAEIENIARGLQIIRFLHSKRNFCLVIFTFAFDLNGIWFTPVVSGAVSAVFTIILALSMKNNRTNVEILVVVIKTVKTRIL